MRTSIPGKHLGQFSNYKGATDPVAPFLILFFSGNTYVVLEGIIHETFAKK